MNKGGERVPGESLWDMEWALKKHEGAENSGFVFNEGKTPLFFPNLCAPDEGLEDADIGFVLNSLYQTVCT